MTGCVGEGSGESLVVALRLRVLDAHHLGDERRTLLSLDLDHHLGGMANAVTLDVLGAQSSRLKLGRVATLSDDNDQESSPSLP